MILGNKLPEELSTETLISLAVVLNNIKIASENSVSGNDVKTLPLEFKFSKIAGIPISRDIIKGAEKSKVEIIKYLMSQGAIEDYRQESLAKSPLGRHIRPDFLVTIKPKVFEGFYNRTMPLALTRVEAKMMYQSQPEASIKNLALPSRNTVLPKVIATLGDFSVHKGHIASYKGQEVPMELQVSKVATFIMERSTNGSYTTSQQIAADILAGNFDYKQPEAYVVKLIAEARKAFKDSTNSKHDYFLNKRGRGYIFSY